MPIHSAEAMNEIERFETTYIAREWWSIRQPNAEPIPVFFCPAQTQAEVLARYPHAGVLPL